MTEAIEPVTVITVTRNEPDELRRAMVSVRGQTFRGQIEHLVVMDDKEPPFAAADGLLPRADRTLRFVVVPRPEDEHGPAGSTRASVYPRLSRLFNFGARSATTPWVCYLDSDNEYEPEHIETLWNCARMHDAAAVHSGRRIFWADRTPYLVPAFPWAADEASGRRIYALLQRRQVWVEDTNILLDQVEPEASTFRNSTVMSDTDPTFLVDQSVWLLRRDLVLRVPFAEQFSEQEIAENTCPDDKLLGDLVRAGVPIYATGLPTVRYYLGGVSNGDG